PPQLRRRASFRNRRGSEHAPWRRLVRSLPVPQRLKHVEIALRLSCRTNLLVRTANGPIVAVPALPFSGRRRKERPLDGCSDGCRDIQGRVARPLIKSDSLLGELTHRRAEVQA